MKRIIQTNIYTLLIQSYESVSLKFVSKTIQAHIVAKIIPH